jgi:hypothetical protein
VRSLRDQLQALLHYGNDDGGFPILRKGEDEQHSRMIGYIGANELEHALSRAFSMESAVPANTFHLGIVADHPDDEVHFHTNYDRRHIHSSSFSSLLEAQDDMDPCDFSVYMDQVCRRLVEMYPNRTIPTTGSVDCSVKFTPRACPSVLREARCSICGSDGCRWVL